MLIQKMKSIDYRKSLYVKVFASFFAAILAITFFMVIVSFYSVKIYRKQAEENFESSLQLYCDYWDSKLQIINDSLLTLATSGNSDDYDNLCNSTDTLTLESSKMVLFNEITAIAHTHSQQIYVFCYFPKKEIFFKSRYNFSGLNHDEKQSFDSAVKQYVTGGYTVNSSQWDSMQADGRSYFIQIYKVNSGYIGAAVNCDSILSGLLTDAEIAVGAAFVQDDQTLYTLHAQTEKKETPDFSFDHRISNLGGNVRVFVTQNKLYSSSGFLIMLAVSILVLSAAIMFLDAQFQMKILLKPLSRFKNAMDRFRQGDLTVRLEEEGSSNEMNSLNKTFNLMAAQIYQLKIDIYETKLERQKIESGFLRLQIQPHFFTNLLNLLYGFAEIKDYANIQRVSLLTSKYLRYLLNAKDALTTLDNEAECVANYLSLQEIRYPDSFDFFIDMPEDAGKFLVPPLILQTFAENSLKHNITLTEKKLEIRIRILEYADSLDIRIEDNGVGFPEELAEKLNQGEDISHNGNHIGIINVKQRMNLLYGDSASLVIGRCDDKTSIQIILPK